jgi:hypothetical protein
MAIYRARQKSLCTRRNKSNIECQVNFAPPCIVVETCRRGSLIKINDNSRTEYVIYCLNGETFSFVFSYETGGIFRNTRKNSKSIPCRYRQQQQIGCVANDEGWPQYDTCGDQCDGAETVRGFYTVSGYMRLVWVAPNGVREWSSHDVWSGDCEESAWTCKKGENAVKIRKKKQWYKRHVTREGYCKIYKIPKIKLVWLCWKNTK